MCFNSGIIGANSDSQQSTRREWFTYIINAIKQLLENSKFLDDGCFAGLCMRNVSLEYSDLPVEF